MYQISRLSLLFFSVSVSALPAVEVPRLFQKAKEQFRLSAYSSALTTLEQVELESQKPENHRYLATLRPGLAFYRGACLAALGRESEARENFEVFLAFSPNASLDPGIYPKKVVALLEQMRRDVNGPQERPFVKAGEEGAVAAAYRAYVPPADSGQPELGEDLAESPVRCLLSPEERRAFSQFSDPVSRSEFVIAFWRARDPRPETPENEFREEFEKRIAFADSRFTDGEIRGSLTDRGVVFLLLGPPTYIGRRPIKSGEDSSDPSGMSRFTRNDVVAVEKIMGSGSATNIVVDNMTSPGNKILDSAASWREVWHYRRELLPKGVPYQQVDFEFISRKGYGKNVLQREDTVLNTLEAARRASLQGFGSGRASR